MRRSYGRGRLIDNPVDKCRYMSSSSIKNDVTSFKYIQSIQANWNAIRVIYGNGDAAIPMKDQERTCLFHSTQLLEKHTKADIRADLQDQHRLLRKQYKNATSPDESETRYHAIRAW
jgi:hypothetical protein